MLHPVLYSERGAITSKPVNGKGVHSWGITERKRRLCRFQVKFSQKKCKLSQEFFAIKTFFGEVSFYSCIPHLSFDSTTLIAFRYRVWVFPKVSNQRSSLRNFYFLADMGRIQHKWNRLRLPATCSITIRRVPRDRAGLRGEQRGQLPRALRSEGAPRDDIYLF